MSTATLSRQWATLQRRWRVYADRVEVYKRGLRATYGYSWSAPSGKRRRLEYLQDREYNASRAIFAWLDEHSPRQWRSGCPAYWICEALTFADAITAGPLSAVPPPAYGHTEADSVRFAGPVRKVGAA